jgi:hypothetical protein
MANFRKVEIEIKRKSGYGQYEVSALYKGKIVKAHTTDSEMFDWLEDDSDKVKHLEAKQRAYSLIRRTFENI